MKTNASVIALAAALLAFCPATAPAQQFFEVDSYTTGVGASGTGHLGSNTFSFEVGGGGRIGLNTSSTGYSPAWMNADYTGPHAAFESIIFPSNPPAAYGRADAIMVGVSSGNTFTIEFDAPQSDLLLLISNFDGNWTLDIPYTIVSSPHTLAVNGSGQLYSTIYDSADNAGTANQGRGVLAFSSPVSSITFTKFGGPADDFMIGLATVPEPSGAILGCLAGTLGLMRRRRAA